MSEREREREREREFFMSVSEVEREKGENDCLIKMQSKFICFRNLFQSKKMKNSFVKKVSICFFQNKKIKKTL